MFELVIVLLFVVELECKWINWILDICSVVVEVVVWFEEFCSKWKGVVV